VTTDEQATGGWFPTQLRSNSKQSAESKEIAAQRGARADDCFYRRQQPAGAGGGHSFSARGRTRDRADRVFFPLCHAFQILPISRTRILTRLVSPCQLAVAAEDAGRRAGGRPLMATMRDAVLVKAHHTFLVKVRHPLPGADISTKKRSNWSPLLCHSAVSSGR
jgi:hypothetical protein